jgi:hypothetical protein
MLRLLITLLLLSSFNSAQESHSAASATEPEAASDTSSVVDYSDAAQQVYLGTRDSRLRWWVL